MTCDSAKTRSQRGQTIALVAVSIVSLLAVAALAIDLTTLYVAKGEIQRAADSAALAGAKAFVDSGVTTDPTNTGLQGVAQQIANSYAVAAAFQNNVAGAPSQMVGSPVLNFSLPGNPRVTVSLQKTNLPVFFARIFGTTAATVAATATAEAYNPAYSQKNLSTFIPAAPKCVKPVLVPNPDKTVATPYVDETKGGLPNPSFLGQEIQLASACKGRGQNKCNSPTWPPGPGEYLPMLLPGTHTYCPSDTAPGCGGGNKSDFEQSTECCDGIPFDFQQCGASTSPATWDVSLDPGGQNKAAQSGLQCLIHTTSTGLPSGVAQQDFLDVSSFKTSSGPPKISPGSFSQARYNTAGPIDTSDSIITVPLFHVPATMPANSQLTIVGFLQLFVNYVKPTPTGSGLPGQGPPDLDAYIVNVIGCGNSAASGAAVSGGGVSPIPVRLVHN